LYYLIFPIAPSRHLLADALPCRLILLRRSDTLQAPWQRHAAYAARRDEYHFAFAFACSFCAASFDATLCRISMLPFSMLRRRRLCRDKHAAMRRFHDYIFAAALILPH